MNPFMDDLTNLRRQYSDLHRELTNRQHVLNAYLKGKLPTERELREQNDRVSNIQRRVNDGSTQWTSTPMRHQSRSPHTHRHQTSHHGTGTDSRTPGKRKSDADTPRQIGRGSSLTHHGSESKRLKSMENGFLRSQTKQAGSRPNHSSRRHSSQHRQDSRERSPPRSCHTRETDITSRRRHDSRNWSPRRSCHRETDITSTERRDEDLDEENVRGADGSYVEQLLSRGNNRLAAARSREVTPNPRSILLTPGDRPKKTPMRVSFLNRLNRGHQNSPIRPLPRSLRDDGLSHSVAALQGSVHDRSYGNMTQPLLGYDWIAGLMDTNATAEEKSDAYLEEIKQFRQMNRDECVHDRVVNESAHDSMNVTQSVQVVQEPHLQAKEHKCIHNYVLNDRLFAAPLHENDDGESLCAICEHRRSSEKKSSSSPSYIRVSIPRSTLQSPYHVRPHRRQSFDPTDSMGLSQHCLAGWQNSRPSMMPPASTIDLKASLDKTMVAATSLFDPTPDQVRDTAGERPLGPSRHTRELLNRSHALRVDLQRLERAGLSMGASRNVSRDYPLL